eukprot:gnl/MRDRNA2_/MRDRNA2_106657_c0_seq1.p1 gnl/MRDRNA2_/MRDRNA2_106657_c0~~gnl/MRDRNA2_/MRDRNA2_106657_c0_seq1.p1  ORF type:complete len:352 (-),score=67.13 gnl/MRDRNA2_/MRDRNA2_106657_c0_seq1:17-1072(-)
MSSKLQGFKIKFKNRSGSPEKKGSQDAKSPTGSPQGAGGTKKKLFKPPFRSKDKSAKDAALPPPGEGASASSGLATSTDTEASATASLYDRLLTQAEGNAGRTAAILHLQSIDKEDVALFELPQVLEALQRGRKAAANARKKALLSPMRKMSWVKLSQRVGSCFSVVVVIFLIFWMFEVIATGFKRNTLVTPTGSLTNRDLNARLAGTYNPDEKPELVAVGDTVHLHELVDTPKLPIRTLRAVHDIVFSHRQAFHVFRISKISKRGSAVEFYSTDGSTIFVDSQAKRVFYAARGEPQEEVTIIPRGSADPWVADSTFLFQAALYEQTSSAATSESISCSVMLLSLLMVIAH